MRSIRVLLAVNTLLVAILACNMPGGQATETPTGQVDFPATITAQALTLQAPTATSAPPTATPTIASTGTPSVPQVSVSSQTNCRTGPSVFFDWRYTMNPGETAEVVGKNTPTGYWIIKYPGGTCWLWGQYATVTGDTSGLTEYPLPATPTPADTATPTVGPVPAAVTNLTYTALCSGSPPFKLFLGGTLYWQDNADDEDGFRVYVGSSLVATLAPDTESYAFTVAGTYGVEAFNAAGASARKTTTPTCP
jgi:hypothetical protein